MTKHTCWIQTEGDTSLSSVWGDTTVRLRWHLQEPECHHTWKQNHSHTGSWKLKLDSMFRVSQWKQVTNDKLSLNTKYNQHAPSSESDTRRKRNTRTRLQLDDGEQIKTWFWGIWSINEQKVHYYLNNWVTYILKEDFDVEMQMWWTLLFFESLTDDMILIFSRKRFDIDILTDIHSHFLKFFLQ